MCPDRLASKRSVEATHTADLLKHVVVQEFDFGNDPSQDESRAILDLQYLIADGAPESAQNLWTDLCAIVRRENEAGGYLDREKLLNELRGRYLFKPFPDYEQDWRRLVSWGEEIVDALPDTIGGQVQLPRSQLVNEVMEHLISRKMCGVIGPSGTGKSVVSKLVTRALAPDIPVLWFDAEEFVSGAFDQLPTQLQLQHRLPEVLAYLPMRAGMVVLDGFERLTSDAGYARVKRLLTAIRAGQQTSPWLVLLSCQIDRWEEVQTRLLRIGMTPSALAVIQMPSLSPEELEEVRQKFPNLSYVFFRPHLSEILQRPKVLDILAAHAEFMKVKAPARWAGESDLINWYWESVVSEPDDGPARSIILQQLGERQADRGESETPLLDLDARDTSVLPHLARDGVCHVNRAQRIRFDHDLIGDWCRQRVLLAREASLDHYARNRVENPHWHKAMRLYGLHLIEGEEGIQQWVQARERLPFFGDLLLDAVVLAANSSVLLEKLWATLQAQNGLLLRRLLTRFLHVATYPDPMAVWMEEHTKQPMVGWIRANTRQPLATYWLGMLQFLYAHRTDIVGLAPLEIAKVVATWLRLPGQQWPFRKEAAELGLAIGEATLRIRLDHAYNPNEDDEKKYDAALAAASEFPDAVADFALRACARNLLPEAESDAIGDYVRPGASKRTYSTFGVGYELPMPEPWPDGPKYRIDEVFQKVCLFGGGVASLMIARPNVAKEVLLALLIREPQPEELENKLHIMLADERVALDYLPEFSPALYDKGPFWLFLGIAPQEALDCILRLVNFATDRWIDYVTQDNGGPPVVTLVTDEGERCYLGGLQVCGWYRGADASDIVTSALMALEDWLYRQLQDGHDIEDVIRTLLAHGNSCAFLGLLWEIGRFRPQLFTTSLRPLLTCAELYQWEAHALPQGISQFGLIGIQWQSAQTQKRIRDWEGMEHRALLARDIALHLFLLEPAMADFFTAAQLRWQAQRDQLPPTHPLRDYLDALIPQFDKENWHESEVQPGKTGFQYVLPPSLHERAERANQATQHTMLLMLPFQCRSILRGEESLAPEMLDSFFATIQELRDNAVAYPEEESTQRITAVCAGIAVLTTKHWDWLISSDERMFWCKTTLLTILREPPETNPVGAEHERNFLSWEDFAAQALIPFWAHMPFDHELRDMIAARVMAHRYSAVTLLTHSAFDFRDQLGEEFDRLIVLVLHWAVMRHDTSRREYRGDVEGKVTVGFDEYRRAFINGTMSTDWGEWGKRAVREGEKYPVYARRRSRGAFDNTFSVFGVHPRIDQTLMTSSFSHILLPGQSHSPTERRRWLRFWEEALACILGAQRLVDEAGAPILSPDMEARRIYESDRRFANTLVEIVLQMEPAEEPVRLWQPILDLGPPAHEWIEMFFSTWLVHGLRSTKQKRFITEWQAMFAYALQSPIWSDRDKCWPHWDDFWLHLLGFDQWDIAHWQNEHETIVEQMMDCYAQWVPGNLGDRGCARVFLHWLHRPAVKPLRLRAIPWLLSAARHAYDYWWDGRELADLLAEIVDVCWREQHIALLSDPSLLEDFRALVSLLARRQNALAMDLQERMATPGTF
jgi:hypothetical protein